MLVLVLHVATDPRLLEKLFLNRLAHPCGWTSQFGFSNILIFVIDDHNEARTGPCLGGYTPINFIININFNVPIIITRVPAN